MNRALLAGNNKYPSTPLNGCVNDISDMDDFLVKTGCKSDQTSADAVFDNRSNSALTYFFLQELNKTKGLTESLTTVVKNINVALGENGYEQEPQLKGNGVVRGRGFF